MNRHAARFPLLLTALGLTIAATPVMAGPYNYDASLGLESAASCSGGNAFAISTSDVTLGGGSASECFGAYKGNNSTDPLLWNDNTWNHVSKIDINEDGGGMQSNGLIGIDFEGGVDSDGLWSFSGDASDWGSFFLVTKAANNPGWAAYYFDDLDGLASLDGSFTIPWTAGNGPNENNPALSHLSLYAQTVASVPEPATLGLMGLGLLGLGLSRRRHTS
ncbi:MAG: PEP-CTERM sorting domain-containing protein [Pseudomonadota bacterium]